MEKTTQIQRALAFTTLWIPLARTNPEHATRIGGWRRDVRKHVGKADIDRYWSKWAVPPEKHFAKLSDAVTVERGRELRQQAVQTPKDVGLKRAMGSEGVRLRPRHVLQVLNRCGGPVKGGQGQLTYYQAKGKRRFKEGDDTRPAPTPTFVAVAADADPRAWSSPVAASDSTTRKNFLLKPPPFSTQAAEAAPFKLDRPHVLIGLHNLEVEIGRCSREELEDIAEDAESSMLNGSFVCSSATDGFAHSYDSLAFEDTRSAKHASIEDFRTTDFKGERWITGDTMDAVVSTVRAYRF
ncbi:MAG: hypothetical protein Q9192_002133 [Flavoplaca navasiana]